MILRNVKVYLAVLYYLHLKITFAKNYQDGCENSILVRTEIERTEIHRESKEHASGLRAIRFSKIGSKAVRLACSGCLLTRDAGSRSWLST